MADLTLSSLLTYTRDGEWGKGEPAVGLEPALVIRGTDFERVRYGNLNGLPLRYIDTKKLERKRLQPGDVLIEAAGGTKDQLTGRNVHLGERIFEEAKYPLICASFARFLRPDPAMVLPKFLFWKLQDEYHSGRMAPFHVQHTGVARFQYTQFATSHEFSLPSLKNQLAIAFLLTVLDDKIELNRRMNETLEAQARALFRDWFVDFGPVKAKMAGDTPYLAPDLWSLFPNRLDDGGVPEGWKFSPLTEHFEIIGGGTPKTSTADYWNGPIPWFSVVDTPSACDVFVFRTEKTITQEGVENSSARIVRAGTTIISARGTVGNRAMAAQDLTFNQSCYALQGLNGASDEFVYLAAGHMVDRLKSMAHGSVFSTITRKTFEGLSLAQPDVALHEAFRTLVSPLFCKIRANVAESHTLAQTRDLLVPKLMSGEIRVAEVASEELSAA